VVGDPGHAHKPLAREPGDPATDPGTWRRGSRRESERNTSAMNGGGKSDRSILPKRPSNKGCDISQAAEKVEGRDLTKENP